MAAAVSAVLAQPTYNGRAGELATEIDALPEVDVGVATLDALRG